MSRATRRPRVAFAFHPAAHYRADFLRALASSGSVDFDFYFDHERTRDPQAMIDPSEVPNSRRAAIRVVGGIVWQSQIIGAVRSPRYRAVVATGDVHDASTWVVLVLGRVLRKPVYLWTQGWREAERGLKGMIRHLFYRLSAGLLLYGDRAKDLGVERGFPPEKLHVIYNSISRRTVLAERVAPVLNEGKGYILCCARIKPTKRLDLLVEALAILRDRYGARRRLVVVGDGSDRSRIEALVMALNLSQEVTFLGPLHDSEVLHALHSHAAMSVIPAHAGLSVIQSLMAQTPVVVDDDPGGNGPEAEAVIEGETGLMFRAGDPGSLAATILRCEEVFPTGRVSSGAGWVLDRYTPEAQAERVLAVLRRDLCS